MLCLFVEKNCECREGTFGMWHPVFSGVLLPCCDGKDQRWCRGTIEIGANKLRRGETKADFAQQGGEKGSADAKTRSQVGR